MNQQDLILGTAQFGLNYGVTNSSGRVSDLNFKAILKTAYDNGIKILDTAAAYGDCEARLGSEKAGGKFSIITKLPPLSAILQSQSELQKRQLIIDLAIQSSRRLNIQKPYAILLHDPADLCGPNSLIIAQALSDIRSLDLADKVGVSIYSREDLQPILNVFDPDIVQCSCNVFDQRLINDGSLKELNQRKIEVHVRSIFLQGLALDISLNAAGALGLNLDCFKRWFEYLAEVELSPLEGALSFIRGIDLINGVVVGVTSENELLKIHQTFKNVNSRQLNISFSRFASSDRAIVDPRTWPKLG